MKERVEKSDTDELNKDNEIEKQENFDVGESVELDLDTDQLNLFNEKD